MTIKFYLSLRATCKCHCTAGGRSGHRCITGDVSDCGRGEIGAGVRVYGDCGAQRESFHELRGCGSNTRSVCRAGIVCVVYLKLQFKLVCISTRYMYLRINARHQLGRG